MTTLQTNEREGWIGVINGRKWHYVIGDRALCGMVILFGKPELGEDESPDNCKGCRRKLIKRREEAAHYTPDLVRDMLSLASVSVSLVEIEGWSFEQRKEATLWAAKEHLAASDNPIKRGKRPAFLLEGKQ